LVLLAVPAASTSLRRGSTAVVGDPAPAKPADIKEKWSKMDDFLEVMFTMACKMKNGKDVAGLAKSKLKSGEVEGADGYAQAVKEIQAGNVKALEKSCGLIIAESKKDCRDGCAARWNQAATDRDDCDTKCESVYANFDRSCKSKAEGLTQVYAQKSQKAAGQKQCYEGHCKEFPMVWMKSSDKDKNTEVEKQCKDRCTDENVKHGCQKKWALEVDFITASVASKCAEDSGLKKCFDGKKGEATTAYDKCQKDSKGSCDSDFADCKKKGNTDKNFKDAGAFCTDRQKMCKKQADEKCVSANKADLDKGEASCEKTAATELKECEGTELGKREEAAEAKCIAKRGPTCKGDCKGKCEVGKMNKCLLMLTTKEDPGKVFCNDFWQLLHASAEVDPVTGNPIAL